MKVDPVGLTESTRELEGLHVADEREAVVGHRGAACSDDGVDRCVGLGTHDQVDHGISERGCGCRDGCRAHQADDDRFFMFAPSSARDDESPPEW